MSIITSPLLLGASAGSVSPYQISRSLRFNSADSAYLSRTPASAGNRKTCTWAGWVKRSALGGYQILFSGPLSQSYYLIYFLDDRLLIENYVSVGNRPLLETASVFRDLSAWYHIVATADTTAATANDRFIIYVNGVRQVANSYAAPSLNLDLNVNQAVEHRIGNYNYSTYNWKFDGYLADIYFIDGQALDPTYFTETDATTGQLVPKAFNGTYGTNGFHLDLSDNSSLTTSSNVGIGKDTSGNGNYWVTNNLSITAGTGNDSLVDSPSSYGTDTGVGGEVRGNYATWNPVALPSATLSNGNLLTTGGVTRGSWASIGVFSGKWYWEYTIVSASIGTGPYYGFSNYSATDMFGTVYATIRAAAGGAVCSGVSYTTSGTGAITSGTVGIALDLDTKTASIYHNNTLRLSVSAIPEGTYYPYYLADTGADAVYLNTGQRAFAYTAPSNFKALCTANLPAPLITKPNTVMDVKLYTGNGSSQSITGLGFSPDFAWVKARSNNSDHTLFDILRGTGKYLRSNGTNLETTDTNSVTSFDSSGFSLGSSITVNDVSTAYVTWAWDAGTSTVTNTQGSITSSVRANVSAGFSIVSYTGSGIAGATVGHGLGVAPQMIILKSRSSVNNWKVGHTSLGGWQYWLQLNTADNFSMSTGIFNNTAPTSTVFTLGSDSSVNSNGGTHIAYCWTSVTGYSSFGGYTGNGSADGPFVYTGFRPKYVIIKRTDNTDYWIIQDSVRNSYNKVNLKLAANTQNAENDIGTVGDTSQNTLDFLSNGFKCRTSPSQNAINAGTNTNLGTYIYAAFAESPFQYARAR